MLGWTELVVIGLIVLLLVSPSRIASAARAIGQSIKEGKKALRTIDVEAKSQKPKNSDQQKTKEMQE